MCLHIFRMDWLISRPFNVVVKHSRENSNIYFKVICNDLRFALFIYFFFLFQRICCLYWAILIHLFFKTLRGGEWGAGRYTLRVSSVELARKQCREVERKTKKKKQQKTHAYWIMCIGRKHLKICQKIPEMVDVSIYFLKWRRKKKKKLYSLT